jgi:hypothetical protein
MKLSTLVKTFCKKPTSVLLQNLLFRYHVKDEQAFEDSQLLGHSLLLITPDE